MQKYRRHTFHNLLNLSQSDWHEKQFFYCKARILILHDGNTNVPARAVGCQRHRLPDQGFNAAIKTSAINTTAVSTPRPTQGYRIGQMSCEKAHQARRQQSSVANAPQIKYACRVSAIIYG
jgi:hypothetical protein